MKLTRLEELISFCKGMGYTTLGIAFCIGLESEARVLHELLEKYFEGYSVCCKVFGIDKEGIRFDIREYRQSPHIEDTVHRGSEGYGGDNDFITGSNAQCVHGAVQRGCSAGDSNSKSGADITGHGIFEFTYFWSRREPVRVEDLDDR